MGTILKKWQGRKSNASESPLDRPLTITKFRDRSASTKETTSYTLIELADLISNTTSPSKERAPLLKTARFGNKKSDLGSLRTNSNMLNISGIEVDYDLGEMPPSRARALMTEAGIACLIYTTPSHKQAGKGNRFRIILPCSRELDPSERERLVARVNGVLGGVIDDASFTPSQSFYYGNVAGGTPVLTYLVDGDYIDLADALDEGALGKKGEPYRERIEHKSDQRGIEAVSYPPEIANDALMAIPNDGDRSRWRNLIAAYKAAGGTLEVATEWSKQHPSFDKVHTRNVSASFNAH